MTSATIGTLADYLAEHIAAATRCSLELRRVRRSIARQGRTDGPPADAAGIKATLLSGAIWPAWLSIPGAGDELLALWRAVDAEGGIDWTPPRRCSHGVLINAGPDGQ